MNGRNTVFNIVSGVAGAFATAAVAEMYYDYVVKKMTTDDRRVNNKFQTAVYTGKLCAICAATLGLSTFGTWALLTDMC